MMNDVVEAADLRFEFVQVSEMCGDRVKIADGWNKAAGACSSLDDAASPLRLMIYDFE
jgi:hypothetical protein